MHVTQPLDPTKFRAEIRYLVDRSHEVIDAARISGDLYRQLPSSQTKLQICMKDALAQIASIGNVLVSAFPLPKDSSRAAQPFRFEATSSRGRSAEPSLPFRMD
jgi:hypothetical protein